MWKASIFRRYMKLYQGKNCKTEMHLQCSMCVYTYLYIHIYTCMCTLIQVKGKYMCQKCVYIYTYIYIYTLCKRNIYIIYITCHSISGHNVTWSNPCWLLLMHATERWLDLPQSHGCFIWQDKTRPPFQDQMLKLENSSIHLQEGSTFWKNCRTS